MRDSIFENVRSKRSFVFALVLLTSCAPQVTQRADCSNFVTSGSPVDQIRLLEEAGARGNVTGLSRSDAEKMFGPGYVSLAPDGKVTKRDAILASWNAQPWASRFDITELDIRVYCDTAIAVGLSEAEPLKAPTATKPTHFRWLNVWSKIGDDWTLSATSYTRF